MFIIRYILNTLAWGFILLGLGGVLLDSSTFADTQQFIYLGMFVLFISPKDNRLTDAHDLAENINNDAVINKNIAKIWEPISTENASFKNKKLVKSANGSLAIHTTFSNFLFSFTFLLFGLIAVFIAFVMFQLLDSPARYAAIIPTLVGIVFISFGIGDIMPKKLAVFDLSKAHIQGDNFIANKGQIPFSKIHGLQLAKYYCASHNLNHHGRRSTSYEYYELNIILKNGERANIMSHGDKGAIILDAKRLANYLSIPIWHKL